MTQLQSKNPQMANQIQQAMNNGTNPQMLMKQMMGNMNNTQMQGVLNQARQMGVPDEVLNQIQNTK